jgi:hypothetical protein
MLVHRIPLALALLGFCMPVAGWQSAPSASAQSTEASPEQIAKDSQRQTSGG